MDYPEVISHYKALLQERLGDNFVSATLFGSVTRGTHTAESDIDILVVVHNENSRIRDVIIDFTFTLNITYNVVLSPIIISAEHYKSPLFQRQAYINQLRERVFCCD